MCKHIWQTVGKVRVCTRCGLTVSLINGIVMHDRKLPGILKQKGKGGK